MDYLANAILNLQKERSRVEYYQRTPQFSHLIEVTQDLVRRREEQLSRIAGGPEWLAENKA